MGTGLNLMNLGLGVAVFIGVCWTMYVLADKSHAKQSRPQANSKKIIRQPWDGDVKTRSRGNR